MIGHVGRTFETTPATYRSHGEEELRDIILAHLNGHYEGAATGETFRAGGKTDIRIEQDDRAAFVAECKVWSGRRALQTSCDQLSRYLTWRDCKAALVLFNKHNASFSRILEQIPRSITEHPAYLRTLDHSKAAQGEWRFGLRAQDDESREIVLHVFAFDLYAQEEGGR